MITFGFGDGGGGPTRKDLEYYNLLKKGLPAVPKAKMEFAGSMLSRVRARALQNPKTPRWQGELYLEYHRGTYTSMAQNKRYNRKSEFLYEKAETTALLANILTGAAYPKAELHDGWETILLNQFHDIIPGSSIKEVYEVSKSQYEALLQAGNRMVKNAGAEVIGNVATDGGVLVFNPNSFEASGTVQLNSETVFVRDIRRKVIRLSKTMKPAAKCRPPKRCWKTHFSALSLTKPARLRGCTISAMTVKCSKPAHAATS